ncbi:MAG: beta(1,3)galactosyltransferase EpsH [Clostridiaceae bacterium]|nr:beta(1,3)galactosyltransferase EpsH [Clostridiaceae bacterium]
MIFITLGSQKFQFDRLLEKIDKLVEESLICEDVFAQYGYSEYRPKYYEGKNFLDRDEFANWMKKSDIVITHGGTGAIIGAVKAGKKVVAVPRLAKYGEHVDDHQLQILNQFDGMGIIAACYELENLGECLRQVENVELCKYVSNTNTIIKSIEEYLDTINNK